MTRPKTTMRTVQVCDISVGDFYFFENEWRQIKKINYMPAAHNINLVFDPRVYSWKSKPLHEDDTVVILRPKV